MRIDKWIRLSLGLGMLALPAVVASHLALTDIYHADGDVSLEWNVLRLCFALIVAAQVAALVTLTQVLVPNEKLGRVESAVTMVIGASTSASMALSGLFGDLVGVQAVFVAAGVITIVAGVAAYYTLKEAEKVAPSNQ